MIYRTATLVLAIASLSLSQLRAQTAEWLDVMPISKPGDDAIASVAVAGDGSVYVTGRINQMREWNGATTTRGNVGELFVARYDRRGREIWLQRGGLHGEHESHGSRIALDGKGGLYLAGVNGDFLAEDYRWREKDQDAFVAMCDTSGRFHWKRDLRELLPEPFRKIYLPPGIAADPEGGVYVAISIDRGAPRDTAAAAERRYKAQVICLRENGAREWLAEATATGGLRLDAVNLGPDGKIMVVGVASGAGTFLGETFEAGKDGAILVAKLDRDGALDRLRLIPGNRWMVDLFAGFDRDGGAVLTGSFKGALDLGGRALGGDSLTSHFLARCDVDGELLWARRVEYGGIGEIDPHSVGVDRDGGIYLGGTAGRAVTFTDGPAAHTPATGRSTGREGFIACYDGEGRYRSTLRVATDGRSFDETTPYAIAGGDFDGVIVAGENELRSTALFGAIPVMVEGHDGFIARVGDPARVTTWGNAIAGSVYLDDNRNGRRDAGERGIPGQTVVVDKGRRSAITDSAGNYRVVVGSGSHGAEIFRPHGMTLGSRPGAIVFANESGERYADGMFGLYAEKEERDLSVEAAWAESRESYETYPCIITYRNNGTTIETGTVTAATANTEVEFDSGVPAPGAVRNGAPVWSFHDLLPGERRTIRARFRRARDPRILSFNDLSPIAITIDPRSGDAEAKNNTATLSPGNLDMEDSMPSIDTSK